MPTHVTCDNCGAPIPPADVNVAVDTAYCRGCGTLSRPSCMLAGADAGLDPAAADLLPPGCRVDDAGHGYGTTLRATARSLPSAAGLLFLWLFWNGIVSVFVCLAIASTLKLAGVPIPGWFPMPHDKHGGSGFGDSLGAILFLWLFLTPFILIGLTVLTALLVSLAGHVSVRVGDGRVFTGIGPVGWPRRFGPADVTGVAIGTTGGSPATAAPSRRSSSPARTAARSGSAPR